MERGAAVLISTLLLLRMAGPVLAAAPDPAVVMREIAAEPYRYGGSLQGMVPGSTAVADQAPIHVSIGLAAPDAQGRVRGQAILFDQKRRLVALGPISGSATGDACELRLSLPAAEVTMSGVCTTATLSGEIVSRPHPEALLTRLVSWWGDAAVMGPYWLTPASFDPGS